MPKLKLDQLPAYRLHKPSGQAVVTLDGRDLYLGRYESAESKCAYQKTITEWIANGRRLPRDLTNHNQPITIAELIASYWRHAKAYYQKNGQPTSEQDWIRYAVKPLRQLYGRTNAADFGPLSLKSVVQLMVDSSVSRTVINGRMTRIKRLFKWAASNEIVPASTYHALQTVSGLRRGRTSAAENEPVLPVPDEYVDAVKPFLSKQVKAMVEIQRIAGLRPGEVIVMRGIDMDTAGRIWHYRPSDHKTAHHGYQRVIELGPTAQNIIRPFLKRELDAYLFNPTEAETERRIKLRQGRKIPVQPSQRNRMKRRPKRQPKLRYSTASYRRAVARACDKAFPPPENLSENEKNAWRREHRWHPNQLRHSYATQIRREHGLEAARILLGHRSMAVTEVYAEIDRAKVADIVAQTG